MTRVIQMSKRRRTPLSVMSVMALLAVMAGVLIGGGTFSSAASTSPSVSDYSQCANGKAQSNACPSGFINGILNANNSSYSEDQVTAQRLVVVFPLAGSHTIDLQYLVRKANNHAYDSLATFDQTQTGAGYCDSFTGKAKTNCESATSGSPAMQDIPADGLAVNSACTTTSTTTSDHQIPGVFKMFGATFTGTPSYLGTTSDTSQGLYQNIEIPITTAGANATVYFYFGGHLAAGLGSRAWGSGCGASNINGGPYHIKLNAIDGTAGSRDNQITAGAIIAQTPSIGTQPSNTGSLDFSETLDDSVSLGGGATGPVHFYLFDNQTDCTTAGATPSGSSTGLLYSQTVSAVAGSAATDNTATNPAPTGNNAVTATGDYYWTVIYDGDGSLNLGASSVCVEHSSFTAPSLPTVQNTAG